MVWRFCDCVLDRGARALVRNGRTVHLTLKAFDVLALLVSERPRALKKTEILDRVWPGTFVTDASLARTIHEIRDAIGDQGSTIRTVHAHGYAFAAEVVEVAAQPAPAPAISIDSTVLAWLIAGLHAVPLRAGSATLGRDPAATIPLQSSKASWHHARLDISADQVVLEDLASKNGTLVRGQRVTTPTGLQDGDEIIIGDTRLVFRRGDKLAATATDDVR